MKKLFMLLSVFLLVSCHEDKSIPPCCDSTGEYVVTHIVEGKECISIFKAVCNKTTLDQQLEVRENIDSIKSTYWKCY